MGNVITFYSFKGGVGRSMCLANVGFLLRDWGYNVLLVDWDLEAPGLENYFESRLREHQPKRERISGQPGLIDMVNDILSEPGKKDPDWKKYVSPIFPKEEDKGRLDLISAGKRISTDTGNQDKEYYEKVRKFDVKTFYEKHQGGDVIEKLRSNWKSEYDFVLIDSRTGITEIGGICTIQLPDILVLLFTSTEASFNGIADVALRAKKAQQDILGDRLKLLTLPILTRVDGSEKKLTEDWIGRFINGDNTIPENLGNIYSNWIPNGMDIGKLVHQTKIPHVPYYSFGEGMPVFDTDYDTNVQGIGYSYLTIAGLLATGLNFPDLLIRDRAKLLRLADRNFMNRKKVELFEKIARLLETSPLPPPVIGSQREETEWTNGKSLLSISGLRKFASSEKIVKPLFPDQAPERVDELSEHLAILIYNILGKADKDHLFLLRSDIYAFISEEISSKKHLLNVEEVLIGKGLIKRILDKLDYLLSDKELSKFQDKISEYVFEQKNADGSKNDYAEKSESGYNETMASESSKGIPFKKWAPGILIGSVVLFAAIWFISKTTTERQQKKHLAAFQDSVAALSNKTGASLRDAQCRLADFSNPHDDEFIARIKDSLYGQCAVYQALNLRLQRADSVIAAANVNLNYDRKNSEVVFKIGEEIDKNEAELREKRMDINYYATSKDQMRIKKLIMDTLILTGKIKELVSSDMILQTASPASEMVTKTQMKVDSINRVPVNSPLQTGWLKQGYYLQFDDLKILLIALSKENQSASVRISDESSLKNNSGKMAALDTTLYLNSPLKFQYKGQRCTINLDHIGAAGKNPFTPAAYLSLMRE